MSLNKTFYQWMDEYERMIRHMIVGFEASKALQDELYQDVALNIWKALPSFQHKASPKTFVARITQNVIAAHVAKAVRTIKSSPFCDDEQTYIEQTHTEYSHTPYSDLDAKQRQLRLSKAIQSLGFEHQQVITLALEGMSYAEMSEILSISTNLVGVRLQRAKQSLTQKLEQEN